MLCPKVPFQKNVKDSVMIGYDNLIICFSKFRKAKMLRPKVPFQKNVETLLYWDHCCQIMSHFAKIGNRKIVR